MTRISLQNLTSTRPLHQDEMRTTQGGFFGGLIAGLVGSIVRQGLRNLRGPVCRRTPSGLRCR